MSNNRIKIYEIRVKCIVGLIVECAVVEAVEYCRMCLQGFIN